MTPVLTRDLNPVHLVTAARRLWVAQQRGLCARDPWEAARATPNPKQTTFTEAIVGVEHDTIIHFGSARAGKSYSTCLGLLQFGYRWPGSRWLVGRYYHNRLWGSTMRSMGEALGAVFRRPWGHISQIEPDVGVWQAGNRELMLVGGATFCFTHFQNAGALGSTEYDGVWIEEAQELPGEERVAGEGEQRSRTPEVVSMLQSRLNLESVSEQWGTALPKLVITAMGWGKNWCFEMAYEER